MIGFKKQVRTDFTLDELRALLAIWQQRLRLQDWDVQLDFATDRDMEGAYGDIDCDNNWRSAQMRLVRPEDIAANPDSFTRWDPERTIVHELLHIHTGPFCPDPNTSEEQAITAIAQALVDGYRR